MRKLSFLPSALALVAGAAGYFIRKIQLATVFDSATGLAERNAPVSIALAALSCFVAAAAIAASFIFSRGRTAHKSYEKAFHTSSPLALGLTAISGIIIAASAVLWLRANVPNLIFINVNELGFFLLGLLSGASVIMMAIASYTGKKLPGFKVFSVFPCLFLCLWMLNIYGKNATNPVILDFIYPCFGAMTACMSLFYVAGYAYRRVQVKYMVFSLIVGIYLCTLSLADSKSLTEFAMRVAFTTVQAVLLSAFLKNMRKSKSSKGVHTEK